MQPAAGGEQGFGAVLIARLEGRRRLDLGGGHAVAEKEEHVFRVFGNGLPGCAGEGVCAGK